METVASFEKKLLPPLLQKRWALFGLIILLQGLVYLSIIFPLWHVRVKEERRGIIAGYDPGRRELRIKIPAPEKKLFVPGQEGEVFSEKFRTKIVVKAMSPSKEKALLLTEIEGPRKAGLPAAGPVTISLRGERILNRVWGKWRGKTLAASLFKSR